MKVKIDDYSEERTCEYKARVYVARDNGAIKRLPREGSRPSKKDNVWTFGKKDEHNGYMIFTGNIRVHQVVCTAFHGAETKPNMVVDHIDTNRCNNRPENLRWVTRLENALNNPITRYKIELICGSVEAFIANPALLRGHEGEEPNFAWMRTVTPIEAKASYDKLLTWANSRKSKQRQKMRKGIGEWIFDEQTVSETAKWTGGLGAFYERNKSWQQGLIEEDDEAEDYIDSLTPNAKQRFWATPTEFVLCPADAKSLQSYFNNIAIDQQFTRNKYGGGIVLDFGYNQLDDAIYVLSDLGPEATKQWALCKITMTNGYFVHENCGSFFEEKGGRKRFTLAMGQEWTGGDGIDDYC